MRRIAYGIFICFFLFSAALAGNSVYINSTAVSGDASDATVGIGLDNPVDLVAGIQLDLVDMPDTLDVAAVTPTGRAAGFSAEFDTLENGAVRILLFDEAGNSIATGDGEVLQVTYNVSGLTNAIIDLYLQDVLLSDTDGNVLGIESLMPGHIFSGTYALLALGSGSGDAGEGGYPVNLNMKNSGTISGIQLDLLCHPQVLMIDSIHTTTATTGMSVDFSPVKGGVRVVLYGGDIAVSATEVPILDLYVSVDPFAVSQDVEIFAENILVGDPVPTIVIPNIFTIEQGYLFPPINLSAVSGLDGVVPLEWQPPEQSGEGETPELSNASPGNLAARYLISAEMASKRVISNPEFVTLNPKNGIKPENLFGYTLYRSENAPVELVTENIVADLDPGTLTYHDSSVVNSTTYYYVVTGDYGDRESGPSNEVSATPVEWVNLAIGSAAGYAGDTVIVPVELVNQESKVGGFEFSVKDIPDLVSGVAVTGTDRLTGSGWSVQGQEQADGSYKVIGFDMNGLGIDPDSGAIANIKFAISTVMEAVDVRLHLDNIVISDLVGNQLPATPLDGAINVMVETQRLLVHGGQADPGETGEAVIELINTQDISGFEFVLRDVPDYLTALEINTTEQLDSISGGSWSDSGSEQDDGSYKALGFDMNGTSIPPGQGPVAVITYEVSATAAIGEVVLILEDIVLSDPEGSQLYSEPEPGFFSVGQPDVTYTVYPDTGMAGEPAEILVVVENVATIGGFQFDLVDSADIFIGTGVSSTLSNWNISGNELDNGAYRVIGFSMTGDTIAAGSTVEFTLDVDVYPEAGMGYYPVFVPDEMAIASDPSGETVWAVGVPSIFSIVGAPMDFSLIYPPDEMSMEVSYDFLDPTDQMVFEWEPSADPMGMPLHYGVMFGIHDVGQMPAMIPSDDTGNDTTLTINTKYLLDELASLGVEFPMTVSGYWYVGATNRMMMTMSSDTFDLEITVMTDIDLSQTGTPGHYELQQNFPNPFNPETSIRYGIPQKSPVKLEIYNLLGQKIATLVNENQMEGFYAVQWDGRDMQGALVKSGVYIYKITAGNYTQARKMILLK